MKSVARTVAVVAVITGVGLIASGVYAIAPADADSFVSSPTFSLTAPLLKVSQGDILAGRVALDDLAPGDVLKGELTVTNKGSQSEWVQLQNDLSGGGNGHPDIFAQYPPTSTLQPLQPGYHAATVSYSIVIAGLLGTAYPIGVSPFSTSQLSPPFELRAGQTATIAYTMAFPLSAGNAYQDATGHVMVHVIYGQEIDSDNGGVQGGTTPA